MQNFTHPSHILNKSASCNPSALVNRVWVNSSVWAHWMHRSRMAQQPTRSHSRPAARVRMIEKTVHTMFRTCSQRWRQIQMCDQNIDGDMGFTTGGSATPYQAAQWGIEVCLKVQQVRNAVITPMNKSSIRASILPARTIPTSTRLVHSATC